MKCLDTTFLIDFLRGEEAFAMKLYGQQLCTTDINVFEVFLGIQALQNQRQREKELLAAEALFGSIPSFPLNQHSAKSAAEIAGTLIRNGMQVDEHDCLTAAIALCNGITTIVTRNVSHFQRITGIAVDRY